MLKVESFNIKLKIRPSLTVSAYIGLRNVYTPLVEGENTMDFSLRKRPK